jgi:lipopolysaccharide transport system ATP-binding protein
MQPILDIQHIGKRYNIAHQTGNYLSMRERISQVFAREKTTKEEFWALKNVSFSVMPGEAIGIIGRNGAGKSTLLKILSKITPPTTGKIISRGRIASLLEVGTGFHTELSGRENIFFNGSLLGMKHAEIKSKFDEIVDFSGVEKFLDTPLKHYSSGMQLRLAFAVAAFLEPEILIIDEVLAVGDAEFQKKCMGKMEDVSKSGRTILFVSHHMAAVRKLCSKAILLKNGQIDAYGETAEISDVYLRQGLSSQTEKIFTEEYTKEQSIILKRAAVYAHGYSSQEPIKTTDEVIFEFDFINTLQNANIDVTVDLFDNTGVHVSHFGMVCSEDEKLPKGTYRTTGTFPANILNTNRYTISVLFGLNQSQVLLKENDILTFDVVDNIPNRGKNFSNFPGVIHPVCKWKTINV